MRAALSVALGVFAVAAAIALQRPSLALATEPFANVPRDARFVASADLRALPPNFVEWTAELDGPCRTLLTHSERVTAFGDDAHVGVLLHARIEQEQAALCIGSALERDGQQVRSFMRRGVRIMAGESDYEAAILPGGDVVVGVRALVDGVLDVRRGDAPSLLSRKTPVDAPVFADAELSEELSRLLTQFLGSAESSAQSLSLRAYPDEALRVQGQLRFRSDQDAERFREGANERITRRRLDARPTLDVLFERAGRDVSFRGTLPAQALRRWLARSLE